MVGPPSRPDVVATVEERAFARLMAVLSISFVICWMPQMVSLLISLASIYDGNNNDNYCYIINELRKQWDVNYYVNIISHSEEKIEIERQCYKK